MWRPLVGHLLLARLDAPASVAVKGCLHRPSVRLPPPKYNGRGDSLTDAADPVWLVSVTLEQERLFRDGQEERCADRVPARRERQAWGPALSLVSPRTGRVVPNGSWLNDIPCDMHVNIEFVVIVVVVEQGNAGKSGVVLLPQTDRQIFIVIGRNKSAD